MMMIVSAERQPSKMTDSNPSRMVMYNIYPRSFKDTDGDGNGDLRGITEKLDYVKDLGANAIWLTPIYPSPLKDMTYDISDYSDVHPMFGDKKAAKRLIDEAHKKDIRVFLDFVPNHTSDQHPWFQESRSSRDNPKRDWYLWEDPVDGHEPNNWISVFEKSPWKFDEQTGQYYLHTFLTEQPDLNLRNPQVMAALSNVMKGWLDMGVDGFRVDATNHMIKQPHLRDEPLNPDYIEGVSEPYYRLLHIYTKDQDEVFDVLDQFSQVVKPYGGLLLTESYPDKRGVDAIPSYMKYYDRLDNDVVIPFNFEPIYLPWEAQTQRTYFDSFLNGLQPGQTPMFMLGNHDRERVASRIGHEQSKVAAVMQLTLPGMPVIYNGEELGIRNVTIPPEKIQDPFAKLSPKDGRDKSRTPMPWNGTKNAGFTTGEPWLPLNSDYKKVNVEAEKKDPYSHLNLYKNNTELRLKKLSALTDGDFRSVDHANENVWAYTRSHDDSKVLVLLNYSDKNQNCVLPFESGNVMLSTKKDRQKTEVADLGSFTLLPNEAVIFTL